MATGITRRIMCAGIPMSRAHEPLHPARNRHLSLPALGTRGGGWVAVQVVLIAAIALSALVGLSWPYAVVPIAYACGALLFALGVGLLVAGANALGSALTPFPAPRSQGELQTVASTGWLVTRCRAVGFSWRSVGQSSSPRCSGSH
jgi:hypothetical protein